MIQHGRTPMIMGDCFFWEDNRECRDPAGTLKSMNNTIVDIHCHLLFGVDDGPEEMSESVQMLGRAKQQGISDIILTPHFRHGMFPYVKPDILANFQALQGFAAQADIGLHLGCEYHVDSKCFEHFSSGRCLTLAGSQYILMEYSHITEYFYIHAMTQEALLGGYIPVIAHAERYPCMVKSPARAKELRRMGALIQVNADAVLGLDGRAAKQYCKTLIRDEAADIIASDSHGIEQRVCHMAECFEYIEKKYSADAARLLLCENPKKILQNGKPASKRRNINKVDL